MNVLLLFLSYNNREVVLQPTETPRDASGTKGFIYF